MTADQQYFLNKLRRHNRYLHGWAWSAVWRFRWPRRRRARGRCRSGRATHSGPTAMRSLFRIPSCSTCPVRSRRLYRSCDPGSLLQGGTAKNGSILFLAIRYEECFARPVRVMPGGAAATIPRASRRVLTTVTKSSAWPICLRRTSPLRKGPRCATSSTDKRWRNAHPVRLTRGWCWHR